MTITLKALRYFMYAVEKRSIAAAAAELSVAASAVAATIDTIEDELGLTLVHRRRAKGVEPTTSGLAIAARARLLIEDHQNLLSFGAELQGAMSGTLKIGYYAPVAPAFLPSILAPILRRNPAVTVDLVECDTENAQEGLQRGIFDAILFIARSAHAGIEVVPLCDAAPYALVSASDPLSSKASVTLDVLCERPLVMLDLPVVRRYYDGVLADAGLTPTVAATAATHEMIRSLVGAGVGRAILNMMPCTDRTYAGDCVCAVPLASDAPPLTLALGLLGTRRRRLVDAFADGCTDFFAKPGAKALVVG